MIYSPAPAGWSTGSPSENKNESEKNPGDHNARGEDDPKVGKIVKRESKDVMRQ